MEQYKDKKWLRKKYIEEKLNLAQIGNLCYVSRITIYYWLKKYNIPIRSFKEAIHLAYEKKIGNDKYCNKRWLENKYLKEKLSTQQLADLCKVSQRTILNWLMKFNIPRRSRSEGDHLRQANHCQLSLKAINFISGELLGDGCLTSQSKHSARFVYGSKHLEYINYISRILNFFGIRQAGKIRKKCCKKWGNYSYHYQSYSYVELAPIYSKWYPNGKKIIPKDIKLNPLTLRQFYIGDGCLEHPKKANPYIVLYIDGFSISDTEWLLKRLKNMGFKATRQLARNVIRISTESIKNFLNYIGKCPVECYEYKWKVN